MTGLRTAVADRVMEIATDALEQTYRDTVDAAPVGKTGALVELIDTEGPRFTAEFAVTSAIFCLAEYAGYTDVGTPPHRIDGRPLLAFYWDNAPADLGGPGDYVFAHVDHPGTTGTQWFNGGREGGEPMRSRWEQACENAAAR